MSETVTQVAEPAKFPTIHTSCKLCTFAIFADKTQVGCQLGRLEKFEKQDPGSVTEVYDAEKEFSVINNRICNAYRSTRGRWAGEHQLDAFATVKEELKVRLTVIIPMQEGVTEGGLGKTAKSLLDQTIPPHQILFLNNQQGIKAGRVHTLLHGLLGNQATWRITRIMQQMSREAAIDEAAGAATGPFFSVFEPGFTIPPTFISELNESLNYELDRWSLLRPVENNGLTVQTQFYKHTTVGGSNSMVIEAADGSERFVLTGIVEKFDHLAETENKPYLVRDVTEVCPCLK